MSELVVLAGMFDTMQDMAQSFDFFTAANVFLFTAVGAGISRSMAVGALGGYMAFAWIAISVDVPLYTNLMYVTLTLIFVGFAFKIIRLEAFGGD